MGAAANRLSYFFAVYVEKLLQVDALRSVWRRWWCRHGGADRKTAPKSRWMKDGLFMLLDQLDGRFVAEDREIKRVKIFKKVALELLIDTFANARKAVLKPILTYFLLKAGCVFEPPGNCDAATSWRDKDVSPRQSGSLIVWWRILVGMISEFGDFDPHIFRTQRLTVVFTLIAVPWLLEAVYSCERDDIQTTVTRP